MSSFCCNIIIGRLETRLWRTSYPSSSLTVHGHTRMGMSIPIYVHQMVNYVVSMITRILTLMPILGDHILLIVIQITQKRDTPEQSGCVGARRGPD
ncbi:hypothetical protein CY34DRAFT_114271 [Suillus luteus UH-Slu-Lm8-n1]|uniref:Uncharacterized protein n=1 Tax=Suillus luteus UH-Slu-Lm8-n1 TaxID=930992 RepID=A0A0D0B622_9AGAM|nr:hypothetical protein CY34DRAFT_114271 [Suillus luteus UH-Slu-Lm8-n1]